MRIVISPKGQEVFDIRLGWSAPPASGQALLYLDREEMRELADAFIQHELDLQERERQRSKNP